jgi:hypothetical protein
MAIALSWNRLTIILRCDLFALHYRLGCRLGYRLLYRGILNSRLRRWLRSNRLGSCGLMNNRRNLRGRRSLRLLGLMIIQPRSGVSGRLFAVRLIVLLSMSVCRIATEGIDRFIIIVGRRIETDLRAALRGARRFCGGRICSHR